MTRLIKASENEVVMRAGSRIEDMRGTRNRADYDMTRKEVERDATAASVVADARRCVENLDASFSGSNRAAIVAAMQGWQKRISPGGS